jgi:hypothetical protein
LTKDGKSLTCYDPYCGLPKNVALPSNVTCISGKFVYNNQPLPLDPNCKVPDDFSGKSYISKDGKTLTCYDPYCGIPQNVALPSGVTCSKGSFVYNNQKLSLDCDGNNFSYGKLNISPDKTLLNCYDPNCGIPQNVALPSGVTCSKGKFVYNNQQLLLDLNCNKLYDYSSGKSYISKDGKSLTCYDPYCGIPKEAFDNLSKNNRSVVCDKYGFQVDGHRRNIDSRCAPSDFIKNIIMDDGMVTCNIPTSCGIYENTLKKNKLKCISGIIYNNNNNNININMVINKEPTCSPDDFAKSGKLYTISGMPPFFSCSSNYCGLPNNIVPPGTKCMNNMITKGNLIYKFNNNNSKCLTSDATAEDLFTIDKDVSIGCKYKNCTIIPKEILDNNKLQCNNGVLYDSNNIVNVQSTCTYDYFSNLLISGTDTKKIYNSSSKFLSCT